jgi:hypothetical protein
MAQPPEITQYDPALTSLSVGGIDIHNFFKGTFVEAEMAENAFEVEAGPQGDVCRVRKNNPIGSVTFRLQQGSSSNNYLTSLYVLDRRFNSGRRSIQVKDGGSTTVLHATQGWIRKIPKMERADALVGVEWVFDCADLDFKIGGSII